MPLSFSEASLFTCVVQPFASTDCRQTEKESAKQHKTQARPLLSHWAVLCFGARHFFVCLVFPVALSSFPARGLVPLSFIEPRKEEKGRREKEREGKPSTKKKNRRQTPFLNLPAHPPTKPNSTAPLGNKFCFVHCPEKENPLRIVLDLLSPSPRGSERKNIELVPGALSPSSATRESQTSKGESECMTISSGRCVALGTVPQTPPPTPPRKLVENTKTKHIKKMSLCSQPFFCNI